MNKNNEISEKDLDKVTGGAYYNFISSWTCPKCEKKYANKATFPKVKEMDGVMMAYCIKCEQWIEKSQWKFTYRVHL